MSDTATPGGAQQHARAQAASAEAAAAAQPTIPAPAATDVPSGIAPADLVWVETIPGGGYAARVLERGTRVILEDREGDACVHLLVFNADQPVERLNVADTIKVQWQAYLGEGALLLSDMGRVLVSLTRDTSGSHDTFCGASTAKRNAAKYGAGDNHGPHPSARDRFRLALAKHGLGAADIGPSISLFKGVRVGSQGELRWAAGAPAPGRMVELRAEMRVLLVLANVPHVLDPRPEYHATALRIVAHRGAVTGEDDPIRNATPERTRAFQNTEYYYAR